MNNPFIIFKNWLRRKIVEFIYPEWDKMAGRRIGERLKNMRSKG